MFDASQLLVRHVRNCFIQGDDSGQCEEALDETNKHSHSPPINFPSATESKNDLSNRFWNKAGAATKVFYVPVLESMSMKEFFSDEDEDGQGAIKAEQPPGCLSDVLASHYSNPFYRYSRFSALREDEDGQQHQALCPSVRLFDILLFLTNLGAVDDGHMTVHANVTSARIVDFIGLILWQYIEEKRDPFLPDLEVAHYALLSADEDGVDFNIPPFDPLEPLSKYGFSSMGLVYVPLMFSKEKSGPVSPRSTRLLPTQLEVTLSHYLYGTHEFLVESKEITLSKLIEMYLHKVVETSDFPIETLDNNSFTLEADNRQGRFIESLDSTLGSIGSYNFIVHRKHCNPFAIDAKVNSGKIGFGRNFTEKGFRRAFRVSVERPKGGRPVDVELVVDPDVLLLNQKEHNTSRSIPKSILRSTIESCLIISTDVSAVPGGAQRARIELIYKPSDRTTKSLIVVISAQVAIELVRLLRQ